MLDAAALAALESGQLSAELRELVRRRVLVDLPKNYYRARASTSTDTSDTTSLPLSPSPDTGMNSQS